jgi:hypothetical protein
VGRFASLMNRSGYAPPVRVASRAAFAAAALAATACSARSGGSLPHARPPAEAAGAPAPAASAGDGGLEALVGARFFRGLSHLSPALLGVANHGTAPAGSDPEAREFPEGEAALARTLSGAGRRVPRILLAVGFAARVAASPARCADALMDPAALARTLDADDSRAVGDGVEGARRVRRISLALLDRGKGPFRYDFRWTFRVSRIDLPGGSVLVRYDLEPQPAPERVSLFHGAAVIEPEGTGSRLSEVVVLGSDLSLPFFLRSQGRAGVRSILAIRAVRIARALR